MEYILTKYGQGRLSIPPTAPNYADYLYYLHFTNGTFQPTILRALVISRSGLPEDNPSVQLVTRGFDKSLTILEEQLSKNTWLAGDEFTAADIVLVFSLTTMRLFYPYSLEGYPKIVAYLKRVSEREGYKRAMEKGDPGFTPLIGAEKPESLIKRT